MINPQGEEEARASAPRRTRSRLFFSLEEGKPTMEWKSFGEWCETQQDSSACDILVRFFPTS